jgi:ribose-phosphate pyrophosphokinase
MQINATLNLAEGFGQCGESIEFKTSKFPAGEIYVRVDVPVGTKAVRVNSRFRGSDDLMRILMACDALQRQGVRYIELFLPYLPYSRQDRVCSRGESFSFKVLAWILIQAVDKVITYDAHSNVPLSIMDQRVKVLNNNREVTDFIQFMLPQGKKLALIAPDAGAVKKAEKLANDTQIFDTVVYCNKRRIGNTIMYDDIQNNLMGMTAVVVDDICDGGATFLALGKKLRERHVNEMHLFVSHGIFSAGVKELKEMYRYIGTTNSMNTVLTTPVGVKCFELDY